MYCIINWFRSAKILFKDCLIVYERVNIDKTFQIIFWYLLCSFRQWNICYLFINLANNGLLIFWNFTEFCLNKIPEKYSENVLNIMKEIFCKNIYNLAALTGNHFHKMSHHRYLTGCLIRPCESKLKCCSAKLEGSIISSYSLHTLYYSSFLLS